MFSIHYSWFDDFNNFNVGQGFEFLKGRYIIRQTVKWFQKSEFYRPDNITASDQKNFVN